MVYTRQHVASLKLYSVVLGYSQESKVPSCRYGIAGLYEHLLKLILPIRCRRLRCLDRYLKLHRLQNHDLYTVSK